MKLSTPFAHQALRQLEEQNTFEEVQLVAESNPAMPQLREVFGDHTFFVDSDGLHILEPAEKPKDGAMVGKLVAVAGWGDAAQTKLAPHEPEPTDVVVVLRPAESD